MTSLAGASANAAVVVVLAALFTYTFAALYHVYANKAMHAMTGVSFAAPLASGPRVPTEALSFASLLRDRTRRSGASFSGSCEASSTGRRR